MMLNTLIISYKAIVTKYAGLVLFILGAIVFMLACSDFWRVAVQAQSSDFGNKSSEIILVFMQIFIGNVMAAYILYCVTFYSTLNVRASGILGIFFWCLCYVTSIILMYAKAYILFGLKSASGSKANGFFPAIYSSVITWTTTGYGDFVPAGQIAQMVAAAEALNGYFGQAIILAMVLWFAKEHAQRRNAPS